jgi:hypothetical protein
MALQSRLEISGFSPKEWDSEAASLASCCRSSTLSVLSSLFRRALIWHISCRLLNQIVKTGTGSPCADEPAAKFDSIRRPRPYQST